MLQWLGILLLPGQGMLVSAVQPRAGRFPSHPPVPLAALSSWGTVFPRERGVLPSLCQAQLLVGVVATKRFPGNLSPGIHGSWPARFGSCLSVASVWNSPGVSCHRQRCSPDGRPQEEPALFTPFLPTIVSCVSAQIPSLKS